MLRNVKWSLIKRFRNFLLKQKFFLSTDPKDAFSHAAIVPNCSWSGFQSANIIIGSPAPKDVSQLFEPEEGEAIIRVSDNFEWPQLLKHLSIFKSASQARKNGWNGSISEGWSEAVFKKQRKAIFVLKVTKHAG